ncbi:Hypothetical_protein [Hexamita inflata]|uniref:Hypothetical_protein n=1 Tax=Hexamita inflata TaxID=28002 RepID=A0ABP1HTF0_9EUKA
MFLKVDSQNSHMSKLNLEVSKFYHLVTCILNFSYLKSTVHQEKCVQFVLYIYFGCYHLMIYNILNQTYISKIKRCLNQLHIYEQNRYIGKLRWKKAKYTLKLTAGSQPISHFGMNRLILRLNKYGLDNNYKKKF